MTLFFSKSGISILGAMIFWAGSKVINGRDCKGLFIWFLDMVMANTTSQEALDLMPGLETIRSELQEDYLVDKAGPTKGLFLLSDNALVAASLTPFLHALNQKCLQSSQSALSSTASSICLDESDAGSEDSLLSEPNDGENRVDAFVQRMQSLYRSKVANWESHVEPYISQWLTWEAQRCKTELDTHFAYVNKQLANACLEGGIDYLDAEKVFEALSYKGGTKGTTALLLEELPWAHDFCETCKEAMTVADRKGINLVHDMTFEPDKVIHSFFSNLDTGKKEIAPNESWPPAEFSVGKVTKRHVHEGEPVFFAFKEMNQEDTNEAPQQFDPRLLSTRVYKSIMKHSADVSFATDPGDK
jgi:hypothetical protein